MKKIIASILVVAAVATTFIGCTKKENAPAAASGDSIKLEMYYYKQENQEGLKNIVKAFEKACGHAIAYEIKPRREGDIATCYCDPQKAKEELGWTAKYGIDEMCEDSWRWQSTNPDGYAK